MTKRDKADAWMPFFVGDYLADTAHLSRDQHGGYLLLLFAGWKRGGRLPDDEAQLANIAKATPREWKMLRPVVAPFFDIANGWWTQKRLLQEHAGAAERKAKSVAKASLAAQMRWRTPVDNYAPSIPPSNASSMPQAMPEAMLEQCPPSLTLSTTGVNPTIPAHAREQTNGGHKNGPENQRRRTSMASTAWLTDNQACLEKARSVGIEPNPGEGWPSLRTRIAQAEAVAARQ